MTDGTNKRKSDGPRSGGPFKKSKGSHAGKWKTSHHKAKVAASIQMGKAFEVGDEGIWVTYARGMKLKAVKEFKELCDEYGANLFGLELPSDSIHATTQDDDAEDDGDIELEIQKELDAIKSSGDRPKTRQTFTPVATGLDCVFFMKTMQPVDPQTLVLRICEDAKACTDITKRKCRYVNRLTPVSTTNKATENGVVAVAKAVLASSFQLKPEETGDKDAPASEEDISAVDGMTEAAKDGKTPFTYAIRHTIRNHEGFKSEEVIKLIAGLIDEKHQVNLSKPDKVILVEIFQLHCGISVVDGGKWTDLKRYNVNELYQSGGKETSS